MRSVRSSPVNLSSGLRMYPTKVGRREKKKLQYFPVVPLSSDTRSEEHTSELQSRGHLVCRLLLEKKKNINTSHIILIHIYLKLETYTMREIQLVVITNTDESEEDAYLSLCV